MRILILSICLLFLLVFFSCTKYTSCPSTADNSDSCVELDPTLDDRELAFFLYHVTLDNGNFTNFNLRFSEHGIEDSLSIVFFENGRYAIDIYHTLPAKFWGRDTLDFHDKGQLVIEEIGPYNPCLDIYMYDTKVTFISDSIEPVILERERHCHLPGIYYKKRISPTDSISLKFDFF